MPKVVIAHASALPEPGEFDVAGVQAKGLVKTYPVISGTDRPLILWRHEIAPGGLLSFMRPAVDHVLYVHTGTVAVDGIVLETEGAIVIEHAANCEVSAPEGATLFHFHEREPLHVSRAGGRVHVAGSGGTFRSRNYTNHEATIWVDGSCATCSSSFHRSKFDSPRQQPTHSHYHTTDEIIVVVKGEMQVGRKGLPPGSALAIDANTPYRFGAPGPGLSFVNFRPDESVYVQLLPQGEQPPINEGEMFRAYRI